MQKGDAQEPPFIILNKKISTSESQNYAIANSCHNKRGINILTTSPLHSVLDIILHYILTKPLLHLPF